MKELLVIDQELNKIQAEGEKRVLEYQAEIEVAKENEVEANKEVLRAKKGEDPKAYAKAIENKRMAINIASYYEGKIEQIKDEPFISKAEYRDYTKRIKAEMDAINNEGKVKASKLFKELEAIKEEVAPAYVKANNLLRELQNNIYKFTYEKQISDAKEKGIPLNTNELHNEYKDNSLITGIDYILKTQVAETIKEGGRK